MLLKPVLIFMVIMNDVGKNMFPTMTYDKFSTQQLRLPLKQSAQDIFLLLTLTCFSTLISPSLLVHEGYGHLQHPRHRLAAPAAQAHDALRPGAVGDTNLEPDRQSVITINATTVFCSSQHYLLVLT